VEEEADKKFLREAMRKLSARDQLIMRMRFGLGKDGEERTQKDVAEQIGISQSYISRLEKRIIRRLRKEFMRAE
ncbi:MAG: sigma-70 family RNA polymerase sigma factor, partial [Selenomonadales bacterium]|nr:sigma-70 family RNA polymerase sigma factor [Selenomonadales bacterium]